jgi:hypothetical protein
MVRAGLGGGSGTLRMVISGCTIGCIGTDPRGKSATIGRLGVRQDVSVQAPSQPAITAQALKAMPMGPKVAHIINTVAAIQRPRVRPIIALLSKAREIELIKGGGEL